MKIINSNSGRKFIIAILIAYLLIQSIRLNSPEQAFFDEKNFYIPAALNLLSENPQLYEHHPLLKPPLGKYILAAGIKLLGNNPIGWRTPALLFGTLGILVTYILAKKIFQKESIALTSAVLMALEFSWFIHSRMAMVEIFFATFAVTSFLFLYDYLNSKKSYHIFLLGAFLGLSLAIKWTALILLFFSLIAIVLSKKQPKEIFIHSLKLVFITSLIYSSIFIPFVVKYSIREILIFHIKTWYLLTQYIPQHWEKDLPAYIPHFNQLKIYLSQPVSWLVDPQFIRYEETSITHVRSVISWFNPLILFPGLTSVIWTFIKNRNDKRLMFLSLIFLSAYLPWFFTPGYSLPYYLLYGIPALSILIAFYLNILAQKYRWLVVLYTGFLIITFIVYYPLLTGFAIPNWYFHLFTRF